MANKNVHVVKSDKNWAVKTEGSQKPYRIVATQEEAINIAKSVAKNNNSEMLIHGRDGRIRERNTYGKDPYPPKG